MTIRPFFSGAAAIVIGTTLACTSPTEPPNIPTVSITTPVTPTPPTTPPPPDTSTFAIPDLVFATALERLGLPIVNGRLLVREALGVTGMTISRGDGYRPPEGGVWTGTRGEYITDLTGLEQFKNLRTLRIEHQKITTIPLHALPKLERLSLWGNPLTTLDVSKNPALTLLGLSETGLTTIDLSMLPQLFEVNFQNDAGQTLPYTLPNGTIVRGFQKLDFRNNPNLTRIYIWNNGLTSDSLFLSEKAHKLTLTDFWAYKNKFTHLSFRGYRELCTIVLYDNTLESLDLREVGPNYPHAGFGLHTTGNPKLEYVRVTSPHAVITARYQGSPIYMDPWTRFIE